MLVNSQKVFVDSSLRGGLKLMNEEDFMLYTVNEISQLTKVTVKMLHYYHKIGLLLPYEVSEACYRLYGLTELERLQEILFFRGLDFPLKKIKQILDGDPDRLSILSKQKRLLLARVKRLKRLVQTIDEI